MLPKLSIHAEIQHQKPKTKTQSRKQVYVWYLEKRLCNYNILVKLREQYTHAK